MKKKYETNLRITLKKQSFENNHIARRERENYDNF